MGGVCLRGAFSSCQSHTTFSKTSVNVEPVPYMDRCVCTKAAYRDSLIVCCFERSSCTGAPAVLHIYNCLVSPK